MTLRFGVGQDVLLYGRDEMKTNGVSMSVNSATKTV